MTPDDRWLAAVWPFVRGQLPPAPATVLEVGCGRLGGFVPALLDGGYDAVGVDPEAPEGPEYQRIEIEHYEPLHPVDCVVASLSLHHVAELDVALDQLQALLVPGGVLVVVEWAWERFDEATAQWSFARLASPAPGAEPGWLHRHQERWAASGKPWDGYLRDWATQEGLHPAEAIHGDLGAITSDDIVIALSYSGETGELVQLLEQRLQVLIDHVHRVLGAAGGVGQAEMDALAQRLAERAREDAERFALKEHLGAQGARVLGDDARTELDDVAGHPSAQAIRGPARTRRRRSRRRRRARSPGRRAPG